MSREDFEGLKELAKQNHAERVAKTPDRIQYKKGYCDGVRTFVESFLKTVREKHYLLSDKINSKDYGMFTVGIEQAVNETKIEISGESDV